MHKGKVQKSRQPESKVVPARRHDLHRGANRTTSRQDGRVAKTDVTDVQVNRSDVQAYIEWRYQGQRQGKRKESQPKSVVYTAETKWERIWEIFLEVESGMDKG